MFLRIEFICIIWTQQMTTQVQKRFLRIEFICIIWTSLPDNWDFKEFLRIEFICIIWTIDSFWNDIHWFLRIEFICIIWTNLAVNYIDYRSWGLNLFVLFERMSFKSGIPGVLEDWIYLYYLNLEMGTGYKRIVLVD